MSNVFAIAVTFMGHHRLEGSKSCEDTRKHRAFTYYPDRINRLWFQKPWAYISDFRSIRVSSEKRLLASSCLSVRLLRNSKFG